uniref:Uncharacterized protein n=1 Tax=Trichuris muris TaxID=70415 RepID=A0A5S6Q814_TRIMR
MGCIICSEVGWVGIWVLCIGAISLLAVALFELSRLLRASWVSRKERDFVYNVTPCPLAGECYVAGLVAESPEKEINRSLFKCKLLAEPAKGELNC